MNVILLTAAFLFGVGSLQLEGVEQEKPRWEYNSFWSDQVIPYNSTVYNRCGADYFNIKQYGNDKDQECLAQVSNELLQKKIEFLQALKDEDCPAFIAVIGIELTELELERPFLFSHLQDNGICVQRDVSAALAHWESYNSPWKYHWYPLARLSDAYWHGTYLTRDADSARHLANSAAIHLYLDEPSALVDGEFWQLTQDATIDPGEVLWGVPAGELKRQFRWILSDQWPLSPPLMASRQKLQNLLRDKTGIAALQFAKDMIAQGQPGSLTDALILKIAQEFDLGEAHFMHASALLPYVGTRFPVESDGKWIRSSGPCIALESLDNAIRMDHKPAIARALKFMDDFKVSGQNSGVEWRKLFQNLSDRDKKLTDGITPLHLVALYCE